MTGVEVRQVKSDRCTGVTDIEGGNCLRGDKI